MTAQSPHQRLRERLAARLASQRPRQGAQKGAGRAPVPDAVIKRQEEATALQTLAKAARDRRMAKALNAHPEFARFVALLNREVSETQVVEPGLVDLDFDHVVRGLGVHKLPVPVRFLALEESHAFIKAVHKSRTRSADITPYRRLFSASFVDSLSEARGALDLH